MIPFVQYLMFVFTLFNGFGFIKPKKDKAEGSSSQQLSSSAPNRITNSPAKRRSTERLHGKGSMSRVEEAGKSGSPAAKTEPIAIQAMRRRSASRTGSAFSLHSTSSVGSAGSRRLGHGTPRSASGSRSAVGSFFSAGSPASSTHSNSGTPKSYSKAHEATWEQAYRNSCR